MSKWNKYNRLVWKRSKLAYKIEKQKQMLQNYKAWGRKPPWYMVAALNDWQTKLWDLDLKIRLFNESGN